MFLQRVQCPSLVSVGLSRPRLGPCSRHLHQAIGQRRSLQVQASAAAVASPVPGHNATNKHPFWSPQWWDVGQSENDKNRKPGKLAHTIGMAWQLIAQEKKLMAAASFMMVRALSLILVGHIAHVPSPLVARGGHFSLYISATMPCALLLL